MNKSISITIASHQHIGGTKKNQPKTFRVQWKKSTELRNL